MQEEKDQPNVTLIDEELNQLTGDVTEIPYSALPLEWPHIVFIVGRIEAFGYSADEILADRELWINMIHPDDRERVFAAFTKCKNEGAKFEIEYRIIDKDGSVHCVIDEGEPVFDEKGQITEVEGIITDVSEFKMVDNVRLRGKSFGVAELKKSREKSGRQVNQGDLNMNGVSSRIVKNRNVKYV